MYAEIFKQKFGFLDIISIHGHTDGLKIDGQTDRETNRQTYRWTKTDKQTDG